MAGVTHEQLAVARVYSTAMLELAQAQGEADSLREELLDFIARTWEFRVSKVALWEFLKKYGLDRASLDAARQAAAHEEEKCPAIQSLDAPSSGGLVPVVGDEFFWPHPVCRGLPAVAPSAFLARNGRRLLQR